MLIEDKIVQTIQMSYETEIKLVITAKYTPSFPFPQPSLSITQEKEKKK